MSNLKVIDFSKGIRDTEIQYNFDAIEQQIQIERKSVGGCGISYGLNIDILDNFVLKINEGVLVDNDGKYIEIPETNINIELPDIFKSSIIQKVSGNRLTLDYIPQSILRNKTASHDTKNDNVIIKSNGSRIYYSSIQDNVILFSSTMYNNMEVSIDYLYSADRIDAIYINKNYEVCVHKGIASTSPSIVKDSDITDCKYVIAYCRVYAVGYDKKGYSQLSILKDYAHMRNIYTDSNNNLYIKGVPFDDLQIIHTVKPSDPKQNDLWFDENSNFLKIYNKNLPVPDWQLVNATSYVPVRHYKIWSYTDIQNLKDNSQSDWTAFYFDYKEDPRMLFNPGQNELDIIINQTPLHSDQFEEISIRDIHDDIITRQLLINNYGYTNEDINSMSETYENTGIGFKLAKRLDEPVYLEAKVTHRVNNAPVKNLFERYSTFSNTYLMYFDGCDTISTQIPYLYNEDQLEVYLNGKRLNKDIDYEEGSDLEEKISSHESRQFRMLIPIEVGAKITYKIIKNIVSYNNVSKLVVDMQNDIENLKEMRDQLSHTLATIDGQISRIDSKIAEVDTALSQITNYATKDDIKDFITADSLTNYATAVELNNVNSSIPQTTSNLLAVRNSEVIVTAGVSKLFVTNTALRPQSLYIIVDETANKYLCRDIDYSISYETNPATSAYAVSINLLKAIDPNHNLYVECVSFKQAAE